MWEPEVDVWHLPQLLSTLLSETNWFSSTDLPEIIGFYSLSLHVSNTGITQAHYHVQLLKCLLGLQTHVPVFNSQYLVYRANFPASRVSILQDICWKINSTQPVLSLQLSANMSTMPLCIPISCQALSPRPSYQKNSTPFEVLRIAHHSSQSHFTTLVSFTVHVITQVVHPQPSSTFIFAKHSSGVLTRTSLLETHTPLTWRCVR